MAKERVKLTDADFDTLFPGRDIRLGNTVLTLRPLSCDDLADIVRAVSGVIAEFSKEGITQKTLTDKETLSKLPDLILKHCPRIVGIASGLDDSDVVRLPPSVAIKLVSELIEINLKDYEELTKNLTALVDRLGEVKALVSAISSNS